MRSMNRRQGGAALPPLLLAMALATGWPAAQAQVQAPAAAPAPAHAPAPAQEAQPKPGEGASHPSLEELLRQTLNEVPREVEESTSSRFAQSAAQAPSVTYVLTDADIARHGMRSMADILRGMPGLYVTGDGNFVYVGARGLGRPGDYNARLLFLVDGMRVNDNIYDAGTLGAEFFVDVDLIDRVEYAPGPGSALYGNNAIFGVVNVITKGSDKLQGLQVRAGVDSAGLREMRASVGHRSENGWDGWLALSAFERNRIRIPYDVAPEEGEQLRAHNWDHGQRLLGMASVAGWTLRGGVSRRTRGFPYIYQFDDGWNLGQQRGTFDNSFISLAHERNIGDWNLYAAVSAKRSSYDDVNPYQADDGSNHEFSNASLGRWRNVDLRLSTHRWRDHDLMAGVEYQFDRQQQIVAGTVGEEPLAQFFGDNRRRGLFVQDAWRLSGTQRLILGLRRDHASIGGGNTNPRLAWIWSGVPDATLKLMYGSAFREANLYEFQANYPFGAPTPAPERVRTLELAWEHTLNHQLQYRLSVYGSQLRDLISINLDTAAFENSAPIRNVGAELGVERRWAGGQQLRAALSLQDTKDEQGRRLSNSPRTLVKLMFNQPLRGDALQLSWQALSVSRRSFAEGDLAGYALLNATLLWRPDLGTDVSVGVHNIGDVRYRDRPGPYGAPIPQERRSLRFSLTRRFGS